MCIRDSILFKRGYTFEEQKIFRMFWGADEEAIQETHVLTHSVRDKDDVWQQAVLAADRTGSETWEMYCFIHGLPTRNPGSWLPNENRPMCGNARCSTLASTEWPVMYERCRGENWALRAGMECSTCAEERRRRCCIIDLKFVVLVGPAGPVYMEVRAPVPRARRTPSSWAYNHS